MLSIEFGAGQEGEHHSCESIRRGDWIIFRRPKCPSYKRKLNWRTGEMKSEGMRADVHHSGALFPHEFREAFENLN